MIKVTQEKNNRVCQGDILANVEYIEKVKEKDGILTVTKIVFPLVVVLSQECDLTWDFENRNNQGKGNQDKYLLSIIVAPLYNYEQFINGTHLSELEQQMATISSNKKKTDNKMLRDNKNPRYHFLEFDKNIRVVDSVVDFKHYFTVNTTTLQEMKKDNFVCSISELYRESLSQRFANYLSRIGLPEATTPESNT